MVSYVPAFDAIRRNGSRIITAVGEGSKAGGYCYARTAAAIADRLGCETVEFPGHHSAYVWRPEEFAAALSATITGALGIQDDA
jgi:hypothetical protein